MTGLLAVSDIVPEDAVRLIEFGPAVHAGGTEAALHRDMRAALAGAIGK